jgi:hypothetical protein
MNGIMHYAQQPLTLNFIIHAWLSELLEDSFLQAAPQKKNYAL